MAQAKNINERLIERIDAVSDRLSDEDRPVLMYIRGQITPEATARRKEWDPDVSHLHEVAKQRLKAYNKVEA